jgi:hypothetical protein
VLTAGNESSFSLQESETRESSGWLKLGRTFSGWTLEAYDGQKEILTLKKGTETLRLPITDPNVKDSKPPHRRSFKQLPKTRW